MSRLVRLKPNSNESHSASDQKSESYAEKIIKYIPSEIIAGYMALNGIFVTLNGHIVFGWLWGSFIFCAVLTPIYFWKLAKPGDAKWTQMILSFIAFLIWAYSVTGEDGIFGKNGIGIYYSQVAAGLLVVFSLVSPLFTPEQKPDANE